MDKKAKIIEYIKKSYSCVGIVLAGSRASGKFSPTSDWDLYVFTNEDYKWGMDTFEGEILDIMVEKYPISENFTFDTKYHPEQSLEILFDVSGGWLQDAVERTSRKYLAGPEKITEDEYRRLKKVMRRYIQKVESRKDVQDLPFYYLSIYYEVALRLWFQLQDKWPLSPHESLVFIEKNDSNFFDLLKDISRSRDLDVQLSAANNIYNKLFTR